MTLTARHVPLVVLTGFGTFVAATGLGAFGGLFSHLPAWIAPVVLALALHVTWVLAAMERSAAGLIVVTWPVCVGLAARGFLVAGLDASLAAAILLETILLLSALAVTPRASWAERLARWRRACAAIDVQLNMTDGLVSWVRRVVRAIVAGEAEVPSSIAMERMAAALADADHALGRRVSVLALPETVRQTLETAGHAVVAEAQTGCARLAVDVERRALVAAAECRDACDRLVDISLDDRSRLATRCETFLVDLSARACGSFNSISASSEETA